MSMNSTPTTVQETNALVAANNTVSTAVQKPAAPAPADTEAPIETNFVEKEQASAQSSASEDKKEEKKTKPKKHRKTNHCQENHKDKQLIVTKKTTIPGSDAFNELMEKRKLYPDYTIVYRTARKSEDRSITNGLTVENMRKYIEIKHPNDVARLNTFDTQKKLSALYSSPITYMRRWFRANYPKYWEDAKSDNKKAANA